MKQHYMSIWRSSLIVQIKHLGEGPVSTGGNYQMGFWPHASDNFEFHSLIYFSKFQILNSKFLDLNNVEP